MPIKNILYTTVTVADFCDVEYINQLIQLNIGMELALLTYKLELLKKELLDFVAYFKQFDIPVQRIRIHQPEVSSFELLKVFFDYCYTLGFRYFTIHPPYDIDNIDQKIELNAHKENLKNLLPQAHIEVEEVKVKVYGQKRFEQLMTDQKATVILDTYECGGIPQTISRLQDLKSKGFKIKSIHLQKDKHKFLTSDEVRLLRDHFSGNFINEGFVKTESSFDEFVRTKSVDCIVSNKERIEILKKYKEILEC